jgi:L-fuculose-phosphate aldolase
VRLANERSEIAHWGRKLLSAGLTTGTGGNLSIFNRKEGLVAITASGVPYETMAASDVPLVGLDAKVVEGDRKPSSELGFHLALYAKRSDIQAIVHTHSVYATTMACLNWEIPAVHYLVGYCGRKVPLAPYATFGTPELARNVADSIGDSHAVLLANHGLVAVGSDLASAFAVAEEIELVARLYYQARSIGTPVILGDEEMSRVIAKFSTYGQRGRESQNR